MAYSIKIADIFTATPLALTSATPSLALDLAGNPYVVWSDSDRPGSAARAFFSKSTGASFTSPVTISAPDHLFLSSSKIAVYRNNTVLVTYVSNSRLFAVWSTDGATTFGSPIQISDPNERVGFREAPIAFDSRGAAYIAYSSRDVTDPMPVSRIKVSVAPDGQNFMSPVEVSAPQLEASDPQIAVARTNAIFVAFSQSVVSDSPLTREIVLVQSTDRGVSFGPPVKVSNHLRRPQFPFVIASGEGRVSVVWEENDLRADSQGDIFLAQSTDGGSTFSSPHNVSMTPGRSFFACGAADSHGNVYIGWTDDSMANDDFLITSAPDFGLNVGTPVLAASRGQNLDVTLNVRRTVGFSGNITITPPKTSKIKIKPASVTVNGSSATFRFKIKGGAARGTRELTFTGSDGSGRTRTAILRLVIQ